MEELQLLDYLSILRRQRKIFFAVAGVCLVLSLLVAASWSNYRSTATVEIAQSEIPDSMTTPIGMNAAPLLESLADMRISRLQQKVLSASSLAEIIARFDLYPDARRRAPIADVAKDMRKKIKIDLVSSSLANPASAGRVSASQLSAIAFRLSFDYSSPSTAQQVANELVSRFLDEDLKERRKQAQETSAFLQSQIESLEKSLLDQERQIAAFRTEHGDVRPEALAFNQQAAVSTMMNLQSVESQIAANLGAQGSLRGQLASVDPYSRVLAEGRLLTTPTIQLKTLKSDYATLTAKYGPEHPDVLKVKRQIESLESQESGGDDTAALRATLTDVAARLETAKKAYGPQNPEVVSLSRQYDNLKAQLQGAAKKKTAGETVADADNPAYLQTVAQLRAAEEQYKALVRQKTELQAQLAKYQAAITENPAVEQKIAELTRDYENAQLRYRDLKAKKMAADMSATIQEDRSGQRLVVIDPPDLPVKTQPARLLFLGAGLAFSLVAGLVAAVGVQLARQSVVGPRHLGALVGVAPFVTVPHLTTTAERIRRGEKKRRLLLLSAVALVVLAVAFFVFVMPPDVLSSVLLRRLGLS